MPPRSERRQIRNGDADTVIAIEVDGQTYTVRMSDITSALDRELFLQSGGLTFAKVGAAFADGTFGAFLIAALVFLSRRIQGEQVTYAEIEKSIDYTSELKIVNGDEENDGPEAPAAD